MASTRHSLRRASIFLAIPVALASCATIPRLERGAADYLAMLPPARTAYLSLDVTRTLDLVPLVAERLGMKGREIPGGTERVRALYAGVVLNPSEGPVFSAIVSGNIPRSCVRTSLGLRGARCVREGGEVWQEDKRSGIQIAAPERGAIVVSNGGIREALAAYRRPASAAMPSEIVSLAAEADLVVFFPKVPDGSGALGVPATPALLELWASADRVGDPGPSESAANVLLDISLGFRMSGEREARLFRPVLRLLLISLERQGRIPGGAEALAGLKDEVVGDVVHLRGLRLTLEQAMAAVDDLLGKAPTAEGAQ